MIPASLHQVFQTIKFSEYFEELLDLSFDQKEQFNQLDQLWSKRKLAQSEQTKSEKIVALTYLKKLLIILSPEQVVKAKVLLASAKGKEARILL